MYVTGRTFRYKLVGQHNFTQGYDPVICYRKYRNWYLKKKAGIIKEHYNETRDEHDNEKKQKGDGHGHSLNQNSHHTEHIHDGDGAYERRRGTAIVDSPDGMLVVQQGHAKFLLSGGGARRNESRNSAAIRELKEETGLSAYDTKFLFQHQQSKVFLVKSKGIPQPHNEISQIAYYKKDSTIPLSYNTKLIIERYWNMTESKNNKS
jgi:hypothetical protein